MLKTVPNSSTRRTWLAFVAGGVIAALPWSVIAQQNTGSIAPAGQVAKTSPAGKTAEVVTIKPKQSITPVKTTKPAIKKVAPKQVSSDKRAINNEVNVGYKVVRSYSVETSPSRGPRAVRAENPSVSSTIPPAGISPNPPEQILPVENGIGPVATIPAGATGPVATGAGEQSPRYEFFLDFHDEGAGEGLAQRVSLRLERASFEDVLIKLFRKTGVDFVIKAKLTHEEMTCGLTNVTAQRALESLLEASDQQVTYREESGVIYIVNKK